MDRSPPPYIVIWTKLIRGWSSIIKGGCRFALQAHRKFLDQVRILVKTKILWNHGRIILSPGAREELYASFGVNLELLRDSIWVEASNSSRGLRRPASIQSGMLKFNPRTVQTATIAKFCSMIGRSQSFAILEWGLVNPEKISVFLQRMKVYQKFRTYYYGLMTR